MDLTIKVFVAPPSLDPSPALDQPSLSGCTQVDMVDMELGSEHYGGTAHRSYLMTTSGWEITPWWTAATGPRGFQCQVSLSVTTDVNSAGD